MISEPIETSAQAYVVFSVTDDKVIASKNDNLKWPTASLAKLIIIYQTMSAIQQGQLDYHSVLPVTANVAAVGSNPDLADIPLTVPQGYEVIDLLNMILLISENQPALQLMLTLFGSLSNWRHQTQLLLAAMKIDGDISNPTGLDDEDLAGFFISQHVSDKKVTKMSANALLLLTKKLILQFPDVLSLAQQAQMVIANKIWLNRNPKIANPSPDMTWAGLKTGFTDRAKQNLIAVITHQHKRYIVVLLGFDGANHFAKFDEAERLIREATTNEFSK